MEKIFNLIRCFEKKNKVFQLLIGFCVAAVIPILYYAFTLKFIMKDNDFYIKLLVYTAVIVTGYLLFAILDVILFHNHNKEEDNVSRPLKTNEKIIMAVCLLSLLTVLPISYMNASRYTTSVILCLCHSVVLFIIILIGGCGLYTSRDAVKVLFHKRTKTLA